MVNYRVVSTQLTEEEHARLLDFCNIIDCTLSSLMRDAIIRRLDDERKTVTRKSKAIQIISDESSQQEKKDISNELAKMLGI